MVPMRDGIKLSTDVYLPDAEGEFPVLLTRTPYDNYNPEQGYYFASRGYAVVMQDVRGRYDSEGEFYPFINEQKDGYDTQQWAATQQWSNGNIGTFGGYYVAATQWQAVLLHNPHVKAMFPYVGGSDIYNHWVYCNGAFGLSINVFWGAVSISTRTSQEMTEEPIDWMHVFKILTISSISDSIGRRVPWYHTSPDRHEFGQIDFGPVAGQDLNQLMLRWFDH